MYSINRQRFILLFVSLVVVLVGFDVLTTLSHVRLPSIVGWLWPIPLLLAVGLCAGRLKDAGRNPWWAALCIMPIFALIGGVALCFMPSRPALRLQP